MIKSYNVLFLIINLGIGSSVIQVMSVYQVMLIFFWATQEKNRAHYMYDIWHLWELLSRSLNVVILDFWSLLLNFYNLDSY